MFRVKVIVLNPQPDVSQHGLPDFYLEPPSGAWRDTDCHQWLDDTIRVLIGGTAQSGYRYRASYEGPWEPRTFEGPL